MKSQWAFSLYKAYDKLILPIMVLALLFVAFVIVTQGLTLTGQEIQINSVVAHNRADTLLIAHLQKELANGSKNCKP